MKTHVVLFDLGNVLVRFDPTVFWSALGIHDTDHQQAAKPRMLELGRIYEAGSITTAEFKRRFSALFEDAYSEEQLTESFRTVLSEPIPGAEDIVKRVARQFDVALVSNTNPIHLDLCFRTIPALKHFHRFYVSYELGALKPDPAFYEGVIRGEGIAAHEMVFIDDLQENIDGANKAGFTGIRFTGAADLDKRLSDLSIL